MKTVSELIFGTLFTLPEEGNCRLYAFLQNTFHDEPNQKSVVRHLAQFWPETAKIPGHWALIQSGSEVWDSFTKVQLLQEQEVDKMITKGFTYTVHSGSKLNPFVKEWQGFKKFNPNDAALAWRIVIAMFDGEPDLWLIDSPEGFKQLQAYYEADWGPNRVTYIQLKPT